MDRSDTGLGEVTWQVVKQVMRHRTHTAAAKRLKMTRQGVEKHIRAATLRHPRLAIHLARSVGRPGAPATN